MMLNKEKPVYYCGVPYNKELITNADLQNINRLRSEIGLEDLVLPPSK
jgi:hypothetical protein